MIKDGVYNGTSTFCMRCTVELWGKNKQAIDRHTASKSHSEGINHVKMVQEAIENSNGAFENDPEDRSRVFCRACDHIVEAERWYNFQRHLNSPAHIGIVEEYDKMVNDGTASSYKMPFRAANTAYRSKDMFVKATKYEGVKVRVVLVANSENDYRCVYYCDPCGKEIGDRERRIEEHFESVEHKKDSKGRTKADFDYDTCRMHMVCKYLILFDYLLLKSSTFFHTLFQMNVLLLYTINYHIIENFFSRILLYVSFICSGYSTS